MDNSVKEMTERVKQCKTGQYEMVARTSGYLHQAAIWSPDEVCKLSDVAELFDELFELGLRDQREEERDEDQREHSRIPELSPGMR